MIIGVPKETMDNENRVGIVPVGVETLTQGGHQVIIERDGGLGSGIQDAEYKRAGAEIVSSASEVYKCADMIMKIKEPLPPEYDLLRPCQIVFTFFHFASNETLTREMLARTIAAIAYETIQTEDGRLPILEPMSEVAGKMAVQEGAKCLEKPMEGRGILLGGVPGVAPANVMILGGGIVGRNAAKVAAGLGAQVVILDKDLDKLRYLDDIMSNNVITLMSNKHNIEERIPETDLLIGAVLIRGAKAPMLVTKELVKKMKPGSVIIDVAIDQGGCIETSHPTTHSDPTFKVHGVVHYCVANMPGAVGRTSTYALTNVTLPCCVAFANKGYKKAMREDSALAKGLNMAEGKVTLKPIADLFGAEHCPIESVLSG